LELFARHGYESTTVAQIAAAAGVTEMTFYRHFGTKAQLLIDDPYDPLIADAIGAQPTHLPVLLRVVRGIRAAWLALPITDEAPIRDRLSIAADTPSLLPVMRASTATTEAAIVNRLVADGADPEVAAVASAAAMAALMTALTRWAQGASGKTLGETIVRALDILEVSDGR
jgi:AcrR family transcriptional regulator